mgnify:CR=1 FL=1
MLLSTSRQVRLAVVTLLVIAAILMIAVIPFIGFDMVNPIVKAQQVRIEKFTAEGNPQAPLVDTRPSSAMSGYSIHWRRIHDRAVDELCRWRISACGYHDDDWPDTIFCYFAG